MRRLLPSVSDTKDLSAPPPVTQRPQGIISTFDSKATFQVCKRKIRNQFTPESDVEEYIGVQMGVGRLLLPRGRPRALLQLLG